jgi:gamma-glutamyltranspeptidase / glutathione hydrolase
MAQHDVWRVSMTFRLCMTALLSTVYLHAAALADEGVRAGGTAQYAVATASSEATDAGMRVLATGGSAADAAVAIQMVLGVVEPQSSGLGGGAIALYQAAQERPIRAFDGLSKSPTSYDPGSSRSAGFAHSGSSVGVPGSLRMLEAMHRRYGKLPWSTLFQPAIRLADAGFAVSPYLARSLAAAIRAGMTVPGWLTDGSGNPAAPGTTVRNPQLADTLRAVSENGADALYVRLADQVVSATHQTAPTGRMTVEDMTGYKVLERDPLCMPLRHQVLCSFPPPSYGGVVVLEMLGILEQSKPAPQSFLDLRSVHRFIEAGRMAEADRMEVVGDPDAGPVPVAELLSPARLRARAARIKDASTIADPRGDVIRKQGSHSNCEANERAPEPSTSQISVVDAWGGALTMTTTINVNFGSWLTVGGFFLNDAMTNFSQSSDSGCSANAPAGDKRAETAMAPIMARDASASVVLVGGSAGAGEIVDYVAQAVIELLAGKAPAEVLDDGHVSTARAPYPSTAGVVELEIGRAVAQLSGPLAAMGHSIRVVPMQSGTAFIVRRHGGWQGAVDPRRDGKYASSR